jgi:virulence-associated protein VagC
VSPICSLGATSGFGRIASDPAPGTPKGDRLDVLVTLLQAYEARHFPIDPHDAIEVTSCRMEAGDLTVTAKLFIHRGGQVVRLPDEFRFEGTEVHVRRVGNEVVLSSVQPPTAGALIDALMAFEMDAGRGVNSQQNKNVGRRFGAHVDPPLAARTQAVRK